MATSELAIVGTGGFAREVGYFVEAINAVERRWEILGYIAEKSQDVGSICGRHRIIGDDTWLLSRTKPTSIVLGVGNPKLLDRLRTRYAQNECLEYPNIVFPNVVGDWPRISIGIGNVICPGSVLTTDIRLGSFNLLNFSCTIGHDAQIGDCNVINPGANISGGVRVGDRNLIGVGAQVLQYLSVGSNIVVGAGAVVTKDLLESGTYVGIPARVIKAAS